MLLWAGLRALEPQAPSTGGPPATPSSRRISSAKKPFSPFPSRLIWTLPLHNALTSEPAYHGSVGYFPIEGNRLAAYDLTTGTLRGIVMAAPRSAPVVSDDLLIADQGDHLTALRTMDGSTAWEIPLA